jgi:hypothetical protein
MFDSPLKIKKVRNGVFAYQYRTGVIRIDGQRYVGWSLTDAIKQYRKSFPAYN